MRKSILYFFAIGLITMGMISCGQEKESESKNNVEADAKKMCDCFKESKNDSKKYMDCSAENEKIREKYKENNDELIKYDEILIECMK